MLALPRLLPLAVLGLGLALALGAGPAATPSASAEPSIQVTTVVSGLSNPWTSPGSNPA